MQGLWFPQRLLIFNWWQLAKKYWESMERHPAKVCQNGCYRLASLWFGLGLLGRCVHSSQDRKSRLDMVPPSPSISFVIAQGSILQTKSVYKMTRPHAYFACGMMCPQVWQGHSCWKLAWLLRTFASFWGVYCSVNFGMVEFAALTVWLHWIRCQSFRTSLDQMTGSHCNSPGKYAGIMISPKTLDIQLVTAGEKILGVNGTPSRKSLSKWLLQTCITLIWTGPPWALRALKPRSTNRLDMAPPSPLIDFVIAQGSILPTKSVYKMTRPHA